MTNSESAFWPKTVNPIDPRRGNLDSLKRLGLFPDQDWTLKHITLSTAQEFLQLFWLCKTMLFHPTHQRKRVVQYSRQVDSPAWLFIYWLSRLERTLRTLEKEQGSFICVGRCSASLFISRGKVSLLTDLREGTTPTQRLHPLLLNYEKSFSIILPLLITAFYPQQRFCHTTTQH